MNALILSMLRTTAFPVTRNPAGMRFIPPVTNGLVCICVWLLRVHSRFLDQSCDFLRQRLEIRRQLFRLSSTTRDTLFPFLFPAPRRAFHHQGMDLLDSD